MPEIDVQDVPKGAESPPPAVIRSARRKLKRSDPPPSRSQTPPADLNSVMAGAPGFTPVSSGFTRLPSPPKFSMDPNTFFQYWHEADSAFPNRGTVYVYRTWPMINRQLLDPEAYKYIDKVDKSFPDPKEWRQEMLHRYGSGNYKLILNDAGGSTKSVGQTLVSDLRDPDYPPVISNLDELVMDDPSNQSYLENLRQKGILPGENTMAAGETASALTGTIDRLATKLAERKPEPAQTQAQPGAADTAKAAMDMARDVFKQGMDLGQETVKAQADAVVAKAQAEASANNPSQSIGLLTQLIGLVKDLTPKTPEVVHAAAAAPAQDMTALVTSLMARGDALQSTMMNMLMEQIKALSAARTPVAVEASAPNSLRSQLKAMIDMKQELQEFLGFGNSGDSGGSDKEDKLPAWMQLAQSALTVLPNVGASAVAVSHNLAIARTGQGSPMSPGELPAMEFPTPGLSGAPNPTAPTQPTGATMHPIILSMLKQIEQPFLTFLNNPEKSGADFAAALMDLHGRTGYDVIRERGKDTLMGWLQAYPPIGQVISQIPERASQFVDDFLNADAILAAEESEEGAAFVQAEEPALPPIVQAAAAQRKGKATTGTV